ncbi:MAG: family transcriptional regulator [Rubritepida sp.]|nr:family transcriptional regulator [Rubritepida sp.]
MLRSPRMLVAARVLAGLNQAQLAATAGIALSVLQAIEQGRSDPKLSTVLALLDVLKARGVELAPETERVAWGVLVMKGSDSSAVEHWTSGKSGPAGGAERGKRTAVSSEQTVALGEGAPDALPSTSRTFQGRSTPSRVASAKRGKTVGLA